MKLNQIEYFMAVANTLNFTKAAESLYISQPALSKQIALLEEEIGVKLFERSSRKVTLTRAGECFRDELEEVLRKINQAKIKAKEAAQAQKTIIKVGCFDALTTSDFLPAFYSGIEKIDSELTIDLVRDSFDALMRMLNNNDIDICITMSIHLNGSDGYEFKKLAERQGAFIYSVNHPLANKEDVKLSDFDGHTFVCISPKRTHVLHDNTLLSLKKTGVKPSRIVEAENVMTLSSYIEAGKGFGILAQNAANSNALFKALPLEDNKIEVLALWKKENQFASRIMKEYK